ncbi:Serine/threonine-protein phosphatase 5 [Schistosoma haematobium]|uniref:protein-serine/threonine phosphatase n=1 Tax=Schistosoma haematobium TaxID=6185 RepID=A0A922LY90_SCHHA|nr:Serine/threonine-protein phosphatase 5 [Schistosoma haematobium]KAH9596076.1 Serine/threonine-protein phosphatase 5 [Schistosoma haematobium]
MTLSTISDEAEALKEEANKFFKDGDYEKAIDAYTKAIEIRETAVYLANRSLAYLRTECFGYALDDASKAISLDSSYVKGYYRRASAHMALGQYKEALADYETVIRVAPSDKMAREKLTECRKIIRRKAFEKAIAVEDQPSPLESFDLSTITVESSYDGPHLEQDSNGKYFVTESFMLALMEHYKSQKVLHKKYAIIIMKDIFLFLRGLPSLVDIKVPEQSKFTVCGDIHGQFYDLMNIFKINGLPSKDNPYVSNITFRICFSSCSMVTLLIGDRFPWSVFSPCSGLSFSIQTSFIFPEVTMNPNT